MEIRCDKCDRLLAKKYDDRVVVRKRLGRTSINQHVFISGHVNVCIYSDKSININNKGYFEEIEIKGDGVITLKCPKMFMDTRALCNGIVSITIKNGE